MFDQTPMTHTSNEGAHVPYLRAVRAHPIIVTAVLVAAIAASVAWIATRPAEYKATAQILVTPLTNDSSYAGLPVITVSSTDPARTLQTATAVLESAAASRDAATKLGDGWTQQRVTRAIDVQPRGDADVVSITATAATPVRAATLANAYARSALSVRARDLKREAGTQIAQLKARRAKLAPTDSAGASQIAAQMAALGGVGDGHDPNFLLFQTATLPTATSGTSTALLLALGLLAGIIIAVGAATAAEYLNRRVRDENEILSIYPLPVLTRVPTLPYTMRNNASLNMMPPRVHEAFRTLQVQMPLDPHGEGRAIMFTSPSPGDGKTASAVNFALVLAAANFRVVLLDFDLRKPDLGKRLNVQSDLMDLFRSKATLSDVLVDASPGLQVISARPHGDVTPLLEALSRRLPDIMYQARALADYVIIDTAPLGPISDALRLAMIVDDIVVVTRPGNTDRTELQHTRELLDRMGHTPTGLVVLGEPVTGDRYETYGIRPHEPSRSSD